MAKLRVGTPLVGGRLFGYMCVEVWKCAGDLVQAGKEMLVDSDENCNEIFKFLKKKEFEKSDRGIKTTQNPSL